MNSNSIEKKWYANWKRKYWKLSMDHFKDNLRNNYLILKFSYFFFLIITIFFSYAFFNNYFLPFLITRVDQPVTKHLNTQVKPDPRVVLLLFMVLKWALLLSSCRLWTWSPWPSLWLVVSTRGQFVLHDYLSSNGLFGTRLFGPKRM